MLNSGAIQLEATESLERENILGFLGINTIHNVDIIVMKFYVPNNIISNYAKQKLYAIK